LHSDSGMEHLFPTLLGIAGALAPVALGYWRQQRRDARRNRGDGSSPVSTYRAGSIDVIIRGGRVYL
jgi:hypothetical protein